MGWPDVISVSHLPPRIPARWILTSLILREEWRTFHMHWRRWVANFLSSVHKRQQSACNLSGVISYQTHSILKKGCLVTYDNPSLVPRSCGRPGYEAMIALKSMVMSFFIAEGIKNDVIMCSAIKNDAIFHSCSSLSKFMQ